MVNELLVIGYVAYFSYITYLVLQVEFRRFQ